MDFVYFSCFYFFVYVDRAFNGFEPVTLFEALFKLERQFASELTVTHTEIKETVYSIFQKI